MPADPAITEFQQRWLPHVTDSGLDRLVQLLGSASPLLIHGCFTRSLPMGCLASHIAWNHPATEHLQTEAGVTWLTRIAKLNPAVSPMILQWDRLGLQDLNLRGHLIAECKAEIRRRHEHFERELALVS